MTDFADPCSKKFFPAYRTSGHRDIGEIKWIVIHDTESGANTASAVAHYFHTAAAQGSAHLVIDDESCFRCLNNSDIPWAAPGANTRGFHIELCARAAWRKEKWLEHDDMLNYAAYKAALHCKKFGVPARFLTANDLKAGRKGITTHAQCTRAFGGSHTDPGSGFPMGYFIDRVQYYLQSN